MNTVAEINAALEQCYGSENFYRHPFSGLVFTDGISCLVCMANCMWLVDAIGSHQKRCMKDESLRDMQFWTLKRVGDNKFDLICERDTDDVAFKQRIEFSNFPLDEIKLWVENNTLYLPSER